MEYDVIEARLVRDFVIWLRFRDGTRGEVDLKDELYGPVFEPLNDPEYFKRFRVDLDTLVWPNGADFAPEFLYERVKVRDSSDPATGFSNADDRGRSG